MFTFKLYEIFQNCSSLEHFWNEASVKCCVKFIENQLQWELEDKFFLRL